MRRRGGAAIAVVMLGLSLLGASSAAAATRFGDECEATAANPGDTVLQLASAPGAALPLAAPAAGVISEWAVRIQHGFVVESGPLKLRVFRATGEPGRFQNVGESAEAGIASNGASRITTRIPVQAGDRLGLYGRGGPGTLVCETGQAADELGLLSGDAPFGSVSTFTPQSKLELPVVATLEPDRDGDGYGDETQDACPVSAEFHGPCPVGGAWVSAKNLTRRAILIGIEITGEAPPKPPARLQVQVFGQVSWRVREPGGGKHGLTVGLSAGAPRALVTGDRARFRLPLTRAVTRRLSRLSPPHGLKALLTVRTTDIAGTERDQRLSLWMPGRKP